MSAVRPLTSAPAATLIWSDGRRAWQHAQAASVIDHAACCVGAEYETRIGGGDQDRPVPALVVSQMQRPCRAAVCGEPLPIGRADRRLARDTIVRRGLERTLACAGPPCRVWRPAGPAHATPLGLRWGVASGVWATGAGEALGVGESCVRGAVIISASLSCATTPSVVAASRCAAMIQGSGCWAKRSCSVGISASIRVQRIQPSLIRSHPAGLPSCATAPGVTAGSGSPSRFGRCAASRPLPWLYDCSS